MVAEMDAAATMLRPLRLEILEHLTTPESASGLARRLGLPRQRLNYHLRELEKVGLLEFVKAERKGNCIERFYRASARHYLISPEALGRVAPRGPAPSPPTALQDRYSWVHLVALLGKALRDLTTLRRRADRANQPLATFSLHTEVRFASPRALSEFREKLTGEVARLVSEYHTEVGPEGRAYAVFLGSYATVTERK